MRVVLHLRPADARVTPWKNGKGVTRELAIWPRGSAFERGDFDARVSRATLAESGPFSSFAGFERVLVITSGDGLVLDHGKAAHRARLRRLDPYRFSGDWPTQAELSGEPVTDFNVFTRRGKLEAVVQALRLGARSLREPLEARFAFVHVLAGTAVARVTAEETAIELVAGDSLRIDDSTGGDELDLGSRSDATELIVVRICG